MNLRRSSRAIILDQDDRILLCRLDLAATGGPAVWVTPGGGAEPGESPLQTCHRELDEELGLRLGHDPLLVWRETAVGPQFAPGYDGVLNDHFLVRVDTFVPRGSWSDERLAAEYITAFRWWTASEISAYDGTDVFGPRDLGARLATLLADGPPASPLHF